MILGKSILLYSSFCSLKAIVHMAASTGEGNSLSYLLDKLTNKDLFSKDVLGNTLVHSAALNIKSTIPLDILLKFFQKNDSGNVEFDMFIPIDLEMNLHIINSYFCGASIGHRQCVYSLNTSIYFWDSLENPGALFSDRLKLNLN